MHLRLSRLFYKTCRTHVRALASKREEETCCTQFIKYVYDLQGSDQNLIIDLKQTILINQCNN